MRELSEVVSSKCNTDGETRAAGPSTRSAETLSTLEKCITMFKHS